MQITLVEGLGAEITDVDIKALSDQEFEDIQAAFADHGLIFFRDQDTTEIDHIAFAERFGDINVNRFFAAHPDYPQIALVAKEPDQKDNIGGGWHTDHSYDHEPALGSVLVARELPESGGDTMFANMYAAYEALSPALKELIDGLTATHASEHVYIGRYSDRGRKDSEIDCPSAVHPVVRTHPDTGRKALFVNRTFTTRINELSDDESRAILEFLFAHGEKIEFQIRYRWSKNDMAFWDNRCCMHYAIWDYWPAERKGRRVTIKGDRPR